MNTNLSSPLSIISNNVENCSRQVKIEKFDDDLGSGGDDVIRVLSKKKRSQEFGLNGFIRELDSLLNDFDDNTPYLLNI